MPPAAGGVFRNCYAAPRNAAPACGTLETVCRDSPLATRAPAS